MAKRNTAPSSFNQISIISEFSDRLDQQFERQREIQTRTPDTWRGTETSFNQANLTHQIRNNDLHYTRTTRQIDQDFKQRIDNPVASLKEYDKKQYNDIRKNLLAQFGVTSERAIKDPIAKRDFKEALVGETTDALVSHRDETLELTRKNYQIQREILSTARSELQLERDNARYLVDTQSSSKVRQMIRENEGSSDPNRQMLAQALKDAREEKREAAKRGLPSVAQIATGLVLGHGIINGSAAIRQAANTNNGFDTAKVIADYGAKAAGGTAGAVAGVAAGGLAAATGVGAWAVPIVAAAVGSMVENIIGAGADITYRNAIEQQKVYQQQLDIGAVTGRTVKIDAAPNAGFSYTDHAAEMQRIAKVRGTSRNLESEAKNSLLLQRGYGIDAGTVSRVYESRQNKNVVDIVGGLLNKGQRSIFAGGDRTMLDETVNKFVSFQNELMKTNSKPSTGLIADQMMMFNSLGGSFSLKDPRALNNMATINNSLVNPNNDAKQAFAFSVLRRQNPNDSFWELQKKQSHGLGDKDYFKGIISDLTAGGTNKGDLARQNVMDFTGLNPDAVDEIFSNLGAIVNGKMSYNDLKNKGNGIKNLEGEAESKTGDLLRFTKQIETAFVQGVQAGMESLAKQLYNAIVDVKNGGPQALNIDRTVKTETIRDSILPSYPKKTNNLNNLYEW